MKMPRAMITEIIKRCIAKKSLEKIPKPSHLYHSFPKQKKRYKMKRRIV